MTGRLYHTPKTDAAATAYDHITWAIRSGLTPADAVALIDPSLRPPTWDHAFGIVERAAAGLEQPTRRAA